MLRRLIYVLQARRFQSMVFRWTPLSDIILFWSQMTRTTCAYVHHNKDVGTRVS